MAEFDITINGTLHRVEAEPDLPLLWLIREGLALTGTKYGCGIGQCGACLILVDNQPTPACLLSVQNARGRSITTIEGLTSRTAQAVQRAWIAHQVPQCGYCQSGQVVAATALLERTPAPSEEAITQAMSPVLCRCGTYPRIKKALNELAMSGPFKADDHDQDTD